MYDVCFFFELLIRITFICKAFLLFTKLFLSQCCLLSDSASRTVPHFTPIFSSFFILGPNLFLSGKAF